ncbi:hypothetical protein BDU57DRAFT_25784 [Ampelomyces quisqualis]|uniref:Uncharacterized protein n=1 Tax=Ampelomyces quisqualis TaxID=50730 RepID=A0A6A5R111_AMPQU|nr:hypothetical protein BDU57DRAFT_25784 [Ampelomyces quisqualis]
MPVSWHSGWAESSVNSQTVSQLCLLMSANLTPRRKMYTCVQLRAGVTGISIKHRGPTPLQDNSFLRQPIPGQLMRHDYQKAMTIECGTNQRMRSLWRVAAGIVMRPWTVDGRCGNHHAWLPLPTSKKSLTLHPFASYTLASNAVVISNSRPMQADPASIDLWLMHLRWHLRWRGL